MLELDTHGGAWPNRTVLVCGTSGKGLFKSGRPLCGKSRSALNCLLGIVVALSQASRSLVGHSPGLRSHQPSAHQNRALLGFPGQIARYPL